MARLCEVLLLCIFFTLRSDIVCEELWMQLKMKYGSANRRQEVFVCCRLLFIKLFDCCIMLWKECYAIEAVVHVQAYERHFHEPYR